MRLRLFLSFTLIVLISITSVVLIARQGAASQVRAFMFRGGMTGTEDLVNSLEDYYRSNHTWQGVQELLAMPGRGQGRMRGQGNQTTGPMGIMNQRIRLADANGQLVFDSNNPSPSGALSSPELALAIPLYANGSVVGYLLPEGGFGFTQNDQTQLVSRITRAALTAGLIAGGLSLLLSLFLAYRLLRPVRELTQAAGNMAAGDLSQRVQVHSKDELGTLATTFNKMADSLQKAKVSRRAMTADIAHELRNPLAVQRANLEALQDGIYPLTPENLASILEQNQLLTRLVDDLRTLALADEGNLELVITSEDLPALTRRLVERFTPQADAAQIQVCFDQVSHCPPVPIDSGRVEQILGNLLSNALRHTPSGGKITLELGCDGVQARLSIRDSGPGIPPESLPQIFERFYRADRSRSRAQGGTGLGLAIARQLAQAHHGYLIAHNHPGGGAVFVLTLPLVP
jgi:signal transduction histidine kinase